jgi:polysaccharide biosynthesis protein PslE
MIGTDKIDRADRTEGLGTSGTLRDVLTILFKKKRTILAIWGSSILLVTIISFVMTPIYEARTSILVKMGREHIYRPEIGNPEAISHVTFESKATIKSEIAILTSPDLIGSVIQKLDVGKLYPKLVTSPPRQMTPMQAAMVKFGKDLSVDFVKDSYVIEATFQHENAELSAQALNLLVDFLKEKHLQAYSTPKTSFLEQQVLLYRQKLNDSEARLQAFKREHGVSSFVEQRRLLLEQRRDLDSSLKTTQNQIKGLLSQLESLRTQGDSLPKEIPLASQTEQYQHQSIDAAKGNLLTLQMREQELLTKYTERSQLVTQVRHEIEVVKKFLVEQEARLADTVTTGVNPVYQQLQIGLLNGKSELQGIQAKREVIAQQLQSLGVQLRELDQKEAELKNLDRELITDQQNFEMYQKKAEEARVSEEMDRLKMTNISIIQPAMVPPKPIKPAKTLYIFLSVVFGGALGISAGLVSEYMARGYTTAEQAAQDLGLPILASFPQKEG